MATLPTNRQSAERRGGWEPPAGRRQGAQNTATCPRPYQFLKQKLGVKKNKALEGLLASHGLAFDSNEAISYVNDCAAAFAREKGLCYTAKTKGLMVSIRHAYDFIKSNLPEDRMLSLDYKYGRFLFFEAGQMDFPDDEVFYTPIVCLEYLHGTLRELMLYVFRLFIWEQGFTLPQDNWYFMNVLNLYDFEDEQEEDEDHYPLYHSYREGHVRALMDEIVDYKGDGAALIEKARSENVRPDMLACLEKGLALLREDRIDRFDYNPSRSQSTVFDNYYDEMLHIGTLCTLTYGLPDNDEIVRDALSYLNSDAENCGLFEMYDVHEITPEYKEWKPSDFPKRFNEWYVEFLKMISNYEPKQTD